MATTAVRESRGRTESRSGGEERKKDCVPFFRLSGLFFRAEEVKPPRRGGEKCVFPTPLSYPRPAPLQYFVACKARLI